MSEEGEMESILSSAENAGRDTGAVVEVKFEKNPDRTKKYLEAEPKALGVTQITLSIFYLSIIGLNGRYHDFKIPIIIKTIFSSAGIIAGSVAIAAQNLHLPTLKACLGMEIVACVSSVICFLNSPVMMLVEFLFPSCWDTNSDDPLQTEICHRLQNVVQHITGIELLVQVTQIALSSTLAAFCCKVIQCCSPRTNVPVVVVNAPPGPQ